MISTFYSLFSDSLLILANTYQVQLNFWNMIPMPVPNTDRNLLLGILALQMDFISRDALIQAMHAWVLDKAKPLGRILVEHGALGTDRRALLEGPRQRTPQGAWRRPATESRRPVVARLRAAGTPRHRRCGRAG